MLGLEKSKLFCGLSSEELRSIEKIAEIKTFQAGEVLFKEGDPGDGMYVIIRGRVQIATIVGQEQQRVLSLFGPGEFFGEMAVLDNEPRSASASAKDESELVFIPRAAMLERLGNSPQLAFSLVREFSLRLREFNRQYVREMLQAERLALVGRFARSIVHDFKNPLAIIGLAADLGATDAATLDMRRLAKERIRKQVDRLSNMINELLEFTRGSQTSNVLALTDYSLFIRQLVDEIQSEVADKSLTLACETPPPSVKVLLDPRRLTHVFYNLIHNAMDVLDKGGKITLRFLLKNRELITEVEDTGPGIAPQIASRLFEPFATYGKAHGTGLGLSICQRIIQDHGGRIQARNGADRGAIFSFSLPLPG